MRHLLSCSLLALAAPLLSAQDDRDRTTPTAAIWLTDQTPAQLNTLANQGWRITDIEIESTSPWEFTVAAVQNTGSYTKTWWWYYGVTGAELDTALANNGGRLVDIEPYDDNGTVRFAAVMVSNTGADSKIWYWYYNQTTSQVNANVVANNARLTSFRRYSIGGVSRWATVMISNTGADQRDWGYLYGASAAAIDANIAQSGNRIYGLERVGTDAYDVILLENNVSGWWQYHGVSAPFVTEMLQQNVARIADIERYSTLLGTRYNVTMVDNANTLERRARQEFFDAPAASLGDFGFFLKEVNGPVLAEMRADTVFEPASTMKTVYHVAAMRRVWLGLSSLSQQVNKPLVCGVAGNNQTLELTLRQMMENSDNMSTLAISNLYGLANLNSTANALGMNSTNINYTIGCTGPAPESELTLRDLTTLHEEVANGYLGSQRQKFYELMANGLSFPSWGTEDLDDRIDAEAVVLGLPDSVRDAFKAELQLAYKPGGIGWTNPGAWTFYFAEGGWMSVPFKNASGTLVPREYTFGVFNYLFEGAANEIPGRNAMCDAELELVWDRVKAAMATWDNYLAGQFTTLLGAGCPGSNGTPMHTASGTPVCTGGGYANYRVTNAPAGGLALAMFGFDNQTWNGVTLPVDLAPVGAPGCFMRIEPAVSYVVTINGAGLGQSLIGIANDQALAGARLYTQFLVLDPPANNFGFTITNAIRTTIGGWL